MVKRVVLGVVLAMVILIGGLIYLLMGVASSNVNQPQGAEKLPVAAVSPQQPEQKVPTLPSLADRRAEREAAAAKAAEKTATKKVATSPTSNGGDGSTFFLTGLGDFLGQLFGLAITVLIIVAVAIAVPAMLPGITVVGVSKAYWRGSKRVWNFAQSKIRPAEVRTEEETDQQEET